MLLPAYHDRYLVTSGPVAGPATGGPIPARHDAIEADSLAARIMENGTAGLTLVDLRSPSAFASYHIPGAMRLGAADLGQARLPDTTVVVLYDEAELSAPRVWLLLKAQGYPRVYVLAGGLAAWDEQVLHPPLPPGMSHEACTSAASRLNPEKERQLRHRPGGCFY